MRGLPASTLLSKFCTVQVLVGPQNLSALRNNEVSAFQRSVRIMQIQYRSEHFVLYKEVSAIENVR